MASSSSSQNPILSAVTSFTGASDDSFDDSCSICLEPFSSVDPATITSCKHEYHLRCIFEWFQRSKECPICCQSFVLKEPASQELLAVLDNEKQSRLRNISPPASTAPHLPEDFDIDHDASYSNGSHFAGRIIRHAAAAGSRARYLCRREMQRSYRLYPSQVLSASLAETPQQANLASPVHQNSIYGSSDSNSLPSGLASDIHKEPPSYMVPPDVNICSITGVDRETPSKPRDLLIQKPSDASQRTIASDMFSLPESLKSKLAATSARYKESVSRNTLGMKDKLLCNNFMKELGREVQREMDVGIAGVARMIERLDLSSKRNATSFSHGPAPTFSKGKNVQVNVIAEALMKDNGDNMHKFSSSASSYVSNTIPGPVQVSCAKRGHE